MGPASAVSPLQSLHCVTGSLAGRVVVLSEAPTHRLIMSEGVATLLVGARLCSVMAVAANHARCAIDATTLPIR